MRLNILNIANKMPKWVNDSCSEYLNRINHGKYYCEIHDIKAVKHSNTSKNKNIELEGEKFIQKIKHGSFLIILDENGIGYTSEEFAKCLNLISMQNSNITIIIGGADGIDTKLKDRANLIMKLSDLTFSHPLVRVVLLEQIYRAVSILENHPYHRE